MSAFGGKADIDHTDLATGLGALGLLGVEEAAASLGKRKSRSGWVAAALRWRSSGNAWGRRLDDHFNDCTCTKYLQRVKMHLCHR